MKVAILHDDVNGRHDATPDERGVLASVAAVTAALRRLGHVAVAVPVGARPQDWLGRLEQCGADVVFNLCEGVAGRSAGEPAVAAVVELLGLPMTGSPASALALARRKDQVYLLLTGAGLPVPPWSPVDDGAVDWTLFPAIVKPMAEDGSVGITSESVVSGPGSLDLAIGRARAYAPLMVQAFVPGRELNVAFVGDTVLPLAEMDFSDLPRDSAGIVSYSAKWNAGSAEDRGTRPVCPATVDARLHGRVTSLALDAWRLVGGRGYGRADLRLDGEHVYVIDVNPNPDLDPGAGLARMATAAGWDYDRLIGRILAEAIS
jgi:D-alanine-D-alanine ligase